jgi:hypothetical protein
MFKAQIDAGRPVMLNLAGHTIVGIGYDTATNTVYLHDTWDYLTHTMTWGGSYSGMKLQSVSIVNLATSAPTTNTLSVSKAGTGSGTVTSAPTGINCDPTCSYAFSANTAVTLTAAASTGSTFMGWSGSGCSGTGNCSVTMDTTKSVTATFTLSTSTSVLSVSKSGTGGGTVTSIPVGINCGSTCSYGFDNNTVVTLTATSSIGSTFTGWSGSGCSGTGTCVVTMDVAKSVTGAFILNTYQLDVSKSGTGTGTVTSNPIGINCGTTCSASYNYNTKITLTAAASTGSMFSGWSGGGCSGTGTCTVTMTAATTVTANFAMASCFTLTTSVSPTGSGTIGATPAPNCTGGKYTSGTIVKLTATPNTGYTFSKWSGSVSGTKNPVSVTMNANKTVTGNFKRR